MIKMGWIGCGRHANQMLLPQLGRNGIKIAALCDSDEVALKRTADQYGVTDRYTDHQALLKLPGLDAIGMAVGPDFHATASILALESGIPVFIEKPPALTAKDAAKIAEASEYSGKPVLVGFMKRYSIGNRMAKNVLRGKGFGDILSITGTYMTGPSYFAHEADYTGFYLHHCIHYMDLIPWVIGDEFEEILVRKVCPSPGKLLLHLNFNSVGGTIGNIVMGTTQSRGTPMEEIRIMGDHVRLHVDNVINVTLYRDPPLKAEDADAALDANCDSLGWSPNFTAAANEDHKGYSAMLADVSAALRGEDTEAPNIHDGVRAMERLENMKAHIKL